MKTIAKTATKKIDAVFASAKSVTCLCLGNNFSREPVSAEYVRQQVLSGNAKLCAWSCGTKFTARVHSNCWFEIIAA